MTDTSMATRSHDARLSRLVDLTAQIITAHAGNTSVASDDLPKLIGQVFSSLQELELGEDLASQTAAKAAAALPAPSPAIARPAADKAQPVASPAAARPAESAPKPAVAIADSVTPGYIVCLEDGRQVKLLHRYLKQRFGLTPAEYRAKWGLPSSYPMVASAYSESRREHGLKVGFKKRDAAPAPAATATPAGRAKRGRPANAAPRAKSPAAKTPAATPAAAPAVKQARPAAKRGNARKAAAPSAEPAKASVGAASNVAAQAPRPRRKLGIVVKD